MLGDDGIYFPNPERPEEKPSRCGKYGKIRHSAVPWQTTERITKQVATISGSQEVSKSRNVQNPLSRPAEIGNQFSSVAMIG